MNYSVTKTIKTEIIIIKFKKSGIVESSSSFQSKTFKKNIAFVWKVSVWQLIYMNAHQRKVILLHLADSLIQYEITEMQM